MLQLTLKVQILHYELHFGLHFSEIFDTDIDVATKTYNIDIQDICLTKKRAGSSRSLSVLNRDELLTTRLVGFQLTDVDSTKQASLMVLTASSVLVNVVPLIWLGEDLQHGALGRHLERTSVDSVVLSQHDTIAVDLGNWLFALNRHDVDVHVSAGMHVVVAVDFLLAVVRHG